MFGIGWLLSPFLLGFIIQLLGFRISADSNVVIVKGWTIVGYILGLPGIVYSKYVAVPDMPFTLPLLIFFYLIPCYLLAKYLNYTQKEVEK